MKKEREKPRSGELENETKLDKQVNLWIEVLDNYKQKTDKRKALRTKLDDENTQAKVFHESQLKRFSERIVSSIEDDFDPDYNSDILSQPSSPDRTITPNILRQQSKSKTASDVPSKNSSHKRRRIQ
jgi:hypothetical protein